MPETTPQLQPIQDLLLKSVRTLAEDFEIDALLDAGPDSALYGGDGPLDSMALVNLIADVEDAVSDQFGRSITLADERAMSARHSPFRDVASLTNAIQERLQA